MQLAIPSPHRQTWRERWSPNGEWLLAAALAAEVLVFAAIAPNFLTVANFFEVVRLSVELGLLCLALTPIIITGGIDLSVGSLMGLAAVVFGATLTDGQMPIPVAVLATLATGAAGGALNAALITRLNLPPLIVTLGSFSLFRGVAEGLTGGAVNYSDFPASFLFLGQGYLAGVVPAQFPIFVGALVGYGVLLHRSVVGRALYAIGFNAAGARYAGIPVARRTGLVYLLAGLMSSLAAVVYVAHLGQAKSDAGTGYELAAITAVVLGGTSVFGGRGTIWGTVFGLFSISVLQNGLRLAALPSELTGILTGTLLLATIAADWFSRRERTQALEITKEDEMRNSQLAILCTAVIGGALIVAGTNVWLVRSIESRLSGEGAALKSGDKRPVIAVMPKAKGDPYFVSCRVGAEQAARELGAELIWDGPTGLDPAKQNEVVEGWITRGVDAIAVSVENQAGISTVLRKARSRGIKVVTWDADAAPDARDFFINQATPEGIANTLTDEAARLLGKQGEFAIITGALTAANQNLWIEFIRKRLEKYPGLKLVTIRPSDDDRDKAFTETQGVLKIYPNVKLIMGIAAPAVPGAAEAVRQAGRTDVNVIGLSLPNLCKRYVHDGIIQSVVLWNTGDLGYLTVFAAFELVKGRLQPGATSLDAGRLGTVQVSGTEVILGKPMIFNKANIDQFNF